MPSECRTPVMQFTLDFAFFLALSAVAARCERPCNCYFSKCVLHIFGKFLIWASLVVGHTIVFFSPFSV